jgi:protein phosphatase
MTVRQSHQPEPQEAPVAVVIDSVLITLVTARSGRARNEDAVGIDGWVLHGEDVNPMNIVRHTSVDVSVVVAVTDGMGGIPGGAVAARIAARELTARRLHRPGSRSTLKAAFQRADDAVRGAGESVSKGMGCTAAVVIVRRSGTAVLGNIGDVRIYRLVGGYLGQLTRDDRLNHDGVVSRCLGGRYRSSVEPHEIEIEVRPGDQLLVCSDGLYDAVDDGYVAEVVRTMRPDHAAATLIKAAKDSGNDDNVTVALLEVQGPLIQSPPQQVSRVQAQPAPGPQPQEVTGRQPLPRQPRSPRLKRSGKVWKWLSRSKGTGDDGTVA